MDKKKVAIIILVFIFLGTMVFTFANPGKEELQDNNSSSEVDRENNTDDDRQDEEDTEKEEEKEQLDEENNNANTVVNTNNANNNNNNNTGNVDVVDYYSLALEAVKKAEASLAQNDVDSAKDLINNVTTDQKEDLLDRINDVQNIIDFDKLLKVLENKTNSFTNKDELNNAREFNTSNLVAEKLNSLKDSASKTKFEERYNVVLLTLNDVTNPEVNGVTEGEYTNRELEIKVVEDSEYVITLDGEAYELGTSIGEGVHVLKVVDKSFNEAVVNFTIDRTYPVVEINGESFDHDNQDIKYYQDVEVEIIEKNIDSITLTKDGNAVEYNNEYVFEEGKYVLTVRDTATNKTVVNFVVDHTAPTVLLKGSNNITFNWGDAINLDTPIEYSDNYTDVSDLIVNTRFTFKAIGSTSYEEISGVDSKKAGQYYQYFTVTDKAGNVSGEVSRGITVIDDEKPVITKLVDPDIYFTVGDTLPPINELVVATDNNDGDITDKVYILKYPDMNTEGTYLVEFYVYDASGKRGYTPLRVHVEKEVTEFTTVKEFSGTRDTVSQMRTLRNMVLDNTGNYVYLGFIQGSTSAGVRKMNISTGEIVKEISLFQPKGLATDDRGYVYISNDININTSNHKIRIYNSDLTSYNTITVVNDHSSVIQSLFMKKENDKYYLYITFNRNNYKNAVDKIDVTDIVPNKEYTDVTLFTINELLGEGDNPTTVLNTIYVDGNYLYVSTDYNVYKIEESTNTIVATANVEGAHAINKINGKFFVTQYLGSNSKIIVLNEDLSYNNTISTDVEYPYTGIDSGFTDILAYNNRLYVANQTFKLADPNRTYFDRILVSPKEINAYIK